MLDELVIPGSELWLFSEVSPVVGSSMWLFSASGTSCACGKALIGCGCSAVKKEAGHQFCRVAVSQLQGASCPCERGLSWL